MAGMAENGLKWLNMTGHRWKWMELCRGKLDDLESIYTYTKEV